MLPLHPKPHENLKEEEETLTELGNELS